MIAVLVLPPVLAGAYFFFGIATKEPGSIGLAIWLLIVLGLGIHFVARTLP